MKARELRKRLRKLGCIEVRQQGSHLIIKCKRCQTVVPVHKGEDIPLGTLHGIEKQLRPCLGSAWFKQ